MRVDEAYFRGEICNSRSAIVRSAIGLSLTLTCASKNRLCDGSDMIGADWVRQGKNRTL